MKGDVLEVSGSANWMSLVGPWQRTSMDTPGLKGAVEEVEEKPLLGLKPALIKSPSTASNKGFKCKA